MSNIEEKKEKIDQQEEETQVLDWQMSAEEFGQCGCMINGD